MTRNFCWLLIALAGCSQSDINLGEVSGIVTLDGEPLAGALVVFSPLESGNSQSLGKTDAEGKYTLNYAPGIAGAQPGEHRVSISTYQRAAPEADPPITGSAERVPLRFNQKSDLVRDVKPGPNTLDFTLTTRP